MRTLGLVVLVALQARSARAAEVPEPPVEVAVECRTPTWRAVRRAVNAWCDGSASVERGYYDWSLTRTRRHACGELRDALGTCDARVRARTDGSADVTVDLRGAEVTYWTVALTRREHDYAVVSVDFVEDCTGP